MSYIYKITNTKNGRMYVGNTSFDIQKRWKEHCHDSRRKRCAGRPLYADMQKYGVECFVIDIIEECDKSIAQEREMFWINKLDTFLNGYNCTLGGNGKPVIDRETVMATYSKTRCMKQTAHTLGICEDSVSFYMHESGEPLPTKREIAKINGRIKGVRAILPSNNIIREFESPYEAAEWIMSKKSKLKSVTSTKVNITKACSKRMKTAYGYIWEYVNDNK